MGGCKGALRSSGRKAFTTTAVQSVLQVGDTPALETETQLAPTCVYFSLLLRWDCSPSCWSWNVRQVFDCCSCEFVVTVWCLGSVRALVFAVTSRVAGCTFSFFLNRKCPIFFSANVSQNLVRKESFWDVPPLKIQFWWLDCRGKVQIIFLFVLHSFF